MSLATAMKGPSKGQGKGKDKPRFSIPVGGPKPSPSSVPHPDPQDPILSAFGKVRHFSSQSYCL